MELPRVGKMEYLQIISSHSGPKIPQEGHREVAAWYSYGRLRAKICCPGPLGSPTSWIIETGGDFGITDLEALDHAGSTQSQFGPE